jgi:hypothetical protein
MKHIALTGIVAEYIEAINVGDIVSLIIMFS